MDALAAQQGAAIVTTSPEAVTADAVQQERMEYIRQLVTERESLATTAPGCDVARRLLEQELERVQSGRRSEEKRAVEVTKEKSIKVTVKVLVPVREHPKFNFVGKLLGPKGNSLKRLQEETMTKMAILGKGSFRDKAKEEELRRNPDPKYGHLQEDLHVEVTAHAPPAEAYARIAYALTEIRRYLVPDHNDEIRQEQMREMQVLSGRSGLGGAELAGVDGHTESSGSLSPPSSLSPPPAAPVKLPNAHQLVAAHAHAHAQAQVQVHTGAATQVPSLMTHPAMRGLTRAQMGLLGATAVPGLPAPGVPGAVMSRFPALLPLGSVAPLGAPHAAAAAAAAAARRSTYEVGGQTTTTTTTTTPLAGPFLAADQYLGYNLTVGLPVYEEYSDVTTSLQTDYDGSMVTDAEKKDAMFKTGAQVTRGRFRHEPYRRLPVNVPS